MGAPVLSCEMTLDQFKAKANAVFHRLFPAPKYIRTLPLEDLTDDELFTLLASEMWKDGAEQDFVMEIASGGDMQFKDRHDCISYLKTVFGWK